MLTLTFYFGSLLVVNGVRHQENHANLATTRATLLPTKLASNDTVEDSTKNHLQDMWKHLKRISALCHNGRKPDP